MTLPTFYKATRPDGTSFRRLDAVVRWEVGKVTRHPVDLPIRQRGQASEYLSVSDAPADCTGFKWPCRLFVVAPASSRTLVWQPENVDLPHKHAGAAFRVIEERPAHEALGPMGEHVADLIARLTCLTPDLGKALADAARDAARDAAWDAARDAARDAAWAAAWDAAWDAARDAAWAAARDAAGAAAGAAAGLLVRDLISTEHYDELTRVVRTVLGPIHPDDPPLP